ncbi:MAG: hypothetical protein Q7K54_06495 [Candidatus Parcubacteria bacterium]|nr:hypothetical protein [Candidatus Parcubacteria bacterium]
MVTPELISFIKGEFAKGKTREMIRVTLVSEGGWSEVDLNEGFRTAIPMQSFATTASPVQPIQNNPMQNTPAQSGSMYNSSPVMQNPISHINPIKINPTQSSPIQSSSVHSSFQPPSMTKSSSGSKKVLLILVITALVGVAVWYFYRAQVAEIWNSLVSSYGSPQVTDNTAVTPEITEPVVDTVIPEPVVPVVVAKDCGTTASPDLKKSATYKGNAVLGCLGNSALICEDAKAVLTDALFPNMMEVVKDQNTNTCNFRLSYTNDSTLRDANGNSLAGQYISCPLSIVKAVDDSKPATPVFKAPTLTDASKYASQIYLYGTLGVFMENNVDINKIQALGCSGNYINSIIMSFQKTQ